MPQIRQGWQAGRSEPQQTKPVFVDRTGKRRRLTVLAGVSIGVGLMVSLALIVAGLFAGSSAPLPGWPDGGGQHQQDDPVAEQPEASLPATTDPSTVTTAVPARTAPTTAATPGQPTGTDRPGQGESHRNTPASKPTKSPGKPG